MTATRAPQTNWSGSYRYRASTIHRPESLEQLRRLLTGTSGTLQVLATRHTFSAIGDADALITLERLPDAAAIEIDPRAMTATVGPLVTYAQLAEALAPHGLALPNLASLPHISVAGAIATATHGSGDDLGNLATAVSAIELLTADGERRWIDRRDPRFPGAVVHLGALGVVLGIRLELVPAYTLRQDVYLDLEWEALAAHFDDVMGAGRSVSVFHDFGARAREVWVKSDPATPTPPELFGARPALAPRNPVPGGPPQNCTPQLGVTGPWNERLPHFRSGFTPSAGEEIQSEFLVARADAVAALAALAPLAGRIQPLLTVAELRVIAADDLWLSTAFRRDSAGLHFTWRRDPGAVTAVCAEVERALAPFAPRPHWGKLFTTPAPRYPRGEDFRTLRVELDPRGVFANEWLREQELVD